MTNRGIRRALFVAALLAAALTAVFVPASDGGLMPASLVFLTTSARALRRLTSPESRRA